MNVPIMKDAQMYSRSQVDDMVKKAMENNTKMEILVYAIPTFDGGQKVHFNGFKTFFYLKGFSDRIFGYSESLDSSVASPSGEIALYTYEMPSSQFDRHVDSTAYINPGVFFSWMQSKQTAIELGTFIEKKHSYIKFNGLHNGNGNAKLYMPSYDLAFFPSRPLSPSGRFFDSILNFKMISSLKVDIFKYTHMHPEAGIDKNSGNYHTDINSDNQMRNWYEIATGDVYNESNMPIYSDYNYNRLNGSGPDCPPLPFINSYCRQVL